MSAQYPDVPNAAGVPPVFRNETNPAGAAGDEPLSQDGEIVVLGPKGWGIYADGGDLALEPDSIYTLEPSREFRISDYPQEAGGFQSYNKVALPIDLRITVTKGGSSPDRQDFLRAVDTIIESTDLFSIVTPDKVFLGFNIVRYEYRRSADTGAGLLVLELFAEEVRQEAESSYTTTREPSGADASNGGPVRPVAPTEAQTPARAPA